MGRSHKYQKARRAERALQKNEQDRFLTREQIIINKMRAVYARYGKKNETRKETNIKTEEAAE